MACKDQSPIKDNENSNSKLLWENFKQLKAA